MISKHIPRILIVDSEPQWSQAVREVLVNQGKYVVESARDVQTALDYSYGDGFDMIMINAALAFGDEVDKFESIVKHYADKVLVISDVRSLSTAIKVFKLGAEYADKPFEPRRVLELVTNHLQQAYGITG